jgi:hypothetical protein
VANPTTNYGFVLPTPTDLVTDLPADFDVALQGVDTRLKALQPGTTEGDLAYSSSTANTNTRLAIGTDWTGFDQLPAVCRLGQQHHPDHR